MEIRKGDTVKFRCGGQWKVEEAKYRPESVYPWRIKLGETEWNATKEGKLSIYNECPFDIVEVIPSTEIPEGFIRWEGGEIPVLFNDHIEVIFRSGSINKDKQAGGYRWNHTGSRGDIIAYRVLPQKKQGELWAVVWTDKSVSIRADKDIYGFASHEKPLAIVPLGIVWQEGDGLEAGEGGEG